VTAAAIASAQVLEAEYRLTGGNSGIQYRSVELLNGHAMSELLKKL
jgi:hypothetical protein